MRCIILLLLGLLELLDRRKGRDRGLCIFFLGRWLGLRGWEGRELEKESGGNGLFSLNWILKKGRSKSRLHE
jgi:hypothetical protein